MKVCIALRILEWFENDGALAYLYGNPQRWAQQPHSTLPLLSAMGC